MSEFANPAATAAGPQAESYASSVIRALGDRDPLELYAGHDIVHLRQIERIRRAVGAA